MANKLFRPHRGGKSKMTSGSGSSHVLADGEIFVEYPDTGAGSGKCKVKMGNGVGEYTELPYALGDTSTDPIIFTEASATTVEAALAKATTGAALQTIIGALKRAVSLCNTKITTEVDDLKRNFQAGVDAVYNAVVAKGTTPASKSLSDIVAAIGRIETATIHTATYTFPGDTGGTKDLGEKHNYRYVNATNVYNKGINDATGSVSTGGISITVPYRDKRGSASYTVPSNAVRAYACCSIYAGLGYNLNRATGYIYVNGNAVIRGAEGGFWNGYVGANTVFNIDIDVSHEEEGSVVGSVAVIYWTRDTTPPKTKTASATLGYIPYKRTTILQVPDVAGITGITSIVLHDPWRQIGSEARYNISGNNIVIENISPRFDDRTTEGGITFNVVGY